MPSIGPYNFLTMDGRLQAASSPTIATLRGLRTGRPRAQVTAMRTVEEQPGFLNAWIQAAYYRAAIGYVCPVTDDAGLLSPMNLIADVRCRIVAAAGGIGAILTTTWTVVPSIGYGTYGTAIDQSVLDASGVKTLIVPTAIAITGAAVTFAGISFQTATGDMQWPISESQITAVEHAAKALGVDNVVGRPQTSDGTLTCTVDCLDEPTAFNFMALIRATVGTFQDLDLGGIIIPGVAVADADCSWREAKALPNNSTRFFSVDLSLGTQDRSGTGTVGAAAVVQVATTWSNWVNVPFATCRASSEGLGGSAGQVSWIQDLGLVLRNGQMVTNEPTDYTGQWCRICSRQNLQGLPDSNGTVLVPVWWGEVLRERISGGSGEGAAVRNVTCAGFIHSMTRCWPLRWYEIAQNGTSTADPGKVLPFNKIPGGDASDNGAGFGSGEVNGFTVHDRYRNNGGDANNAPQPAPMRWNALELVQLWIKAYQVQYPQGAKVTLTGQTAALSFVSAWDLTLKDFGNGLCEVVSPRWGLSMRIEISTADAVTIRVNTGCQAATAIPGFGNLPANDRQAVLDLTGKDVISWDIDRTRETEVDHAIILGGHPQYVMTMGLGTQGALNYQFAKGWDAFSTVNEENAWANATTEQRDSPQLVHVWRRWKIAPDWNGGGFFRAGGALPFWFLNRAVATSVQNGVGGYTGEFASGGLPLRSETVRFLRELPIWTQKDWAAIVGSGTQLATATPGRQHDGPILFGFKSNGTYEFLSHRWNVQVEDDCGAIVLGHDSRDGAAIQAYLAAGNSILVTIGITYPWPWAVSWRRAQTSRPRDQERCIVLPFPHHFYRQIIKGTALSLDNPTTIKTAQNDIRLDWETVAGSGVSKLDPLLALARIRYGSPQKSCSWTRKGVIDSSLTTAPGSMVTVATAPLDAHRQFSETVNAVITGRHHNHVAGQCETSFTAEPLLPALDKVLLANPVPFRGLGAILGPHPGYH